MDMNVGMRMVWCDVGEVDNVNAMSYVTWP